MRDAQYLVAQAKQEIMEVEVTRAELAINNAHLLIDVREPAEYDSGHIEGAISIPRGMLEFTMSSRPELSLGNLNIVVYCKTSGRAALAAQSLKSMGYQNVQSIAGGLQAWLAAGKAIQTPPLIDYL